MVTYCCVPQCKSKWSKDNPEVKFHKTPSDPVLAGVWLATIKLDKPFSPHSKVCSRHFGEEDYMGTLSDQWKMLRKTAVPSLNLPLSSDDVTAATRDAQEPTPDRTPGAGSDSPTEAGEGGRLHPSETQDCDVGRTKGKMSRPGGRSYNKRPPDVGLQMECYDEELSSHQTSQYNKVERELKDVNAKIELRIKKEGGEIIEKGDGVYVVLIENPIGSPPVPSLNAATPTTGPAANSPATRQSAMIAQPSPASGPAVVQTLQTPVILQGPSPTGGVVTRAGTGNTIPGTYQLMMDPRLGLIVGTVTSAQPTAGTPVIQTTTSLAKSPNAQVTQSVHPQTRSTPQARTMPARGAQQPVATGKQGAMPVASASTGNKVSALPAAARSAANANMSSIRVKAKTQQASSTTRPTENNVIGGLSTGGKNWKNNNNNNVAPIVDLTTDDRPATNSSVTNSAPDSREVTFNKLSGKTFPSLVVVARPNLRIKELAPSTVSAERATLDQKVKSVLMFTPTKFTEWLIQQGLVRSEQYCSSHMGSDMTPVRLKLGMYSDVSKFPYSGGYVWISECCPQRFVSVFSGSIFEGAPHPPTVLLKLIYHWACQTNVQNVVQWVKVDNFYVKNFFTNMRSVCTAAVHEKYEKMGGLRKRVEVGVISLGTTSQDGNMRQVKVEVLGVMDPESKLIRLRAVEPLQDGERNYKKRFVKILEPLEQWVDRDSIILTDFTVDKGTLHNMGFNSVYQVSITETPAPQNKYSNQNVMEYLRRIVPRMFQNTLSLLSRQIIQQFLDELVWRERWGPVAAQAFENIIVHMAEQTKLETGDNLLSRLSKVASNPFKQWNYANWKTAPVTNGLPAPAAMAAQSLSPPPPKSAKSAPAAAALTPEPLRPVGIDMLPQSIRMVDPAPGMKRGRKRTLPSAEALAPEPKRLTDPSPKRASVPSPVPEEQTALDSYYYGTLAGDAEVLKTEVKTAVTVKCFMCQRNFVNNIALMKHLILHAQAENQFSSELSDVTQCKYCLKSFPTPFSMQTHMEEIHLKTSTGLVCRICEEKFRDRTILVAHMHRTHVAMELPYACGICKFRSSMHRDIIDHFYEVHNMGEKLQCPFCLKTVAFSNQGRKMSANINFFFNHILKHQRKSIARKCNKCVLWFVHKGILKEHQLRDHISYKGVPGVKMFIHPSGMDVMMPVPSAASIGARGSFTQKKNLSCFPKLRTNYTTQQFESLSIYCGQESATCCECEGDFLGEDHFPGYLSCSRCRFSTCCSKAMAEHTVVFHELAKSNPEFTLGRIIHLPNEMYCVCGFCTASGNRLAKHLARCERKSAYPSPSRAKAATIQSASFPPLVTLDDVENASEDPSDRWLKAFVPSRKDESEGSREVPEKKATSQQERVDPPSMLNILGLVRKASTDESSLDRAASDSEGPPELKVEEPVDLALQSTQLFPMYPHLLKACISFLCMPRDTQDTEISSSKASERPHKREEKMHPAKRRLLLKPGLLRRTLLADVDMDVDSDDPPALEKTLQEETRSDTLSATEEGDGSDDLYPATALVEATLNEDSMGDVIVPVVEMKEEPTESGPIKRDVEAEEIPTAKGPIVPPVEMPEIPPDVGPVVPTVETGEDESGSTSTVPAVETDCEPAAEVVPTETKDEDSKSGLDISSTSELEGKSPPKDLSKPGAVAVEDESPTTDSAKPTALEMETKQSEAAGTKEAPTLPDCTAGAEDVTMKVEDDVAQASRSAVADVSMAMEGTGK